MHYMKYSEIGRRIAIRRRRLCMTQAEVEDKANLSRRYLSNIERGRSVPSIDVLMQIADVLHCTPNELLLGADAGAVSGTQQTGMATAEFSSEIPQNSELAAALSADLKRLSGYKQAIARSFINWLEAQQL